jgi:hypothetical protein
MLRTISLIIVWFVHSCLIGSFRLTDLPISSGNFPLTFIDISRNQFKDPRIIEQWKKGTDHLCQFLEMRMDCAPKKKSKEDQGPKTPIENHGPKLVKSLSKDQERVSEKKPPSDAKQLKETSSGERNVISPSPMRIPKKVAPATNSPVVLVTPEPSKSPSRTHQKHADSNDAKLAPEKITPRGIPSLQKGHKSQVSAENLSIASPRTLPSFPRAHTDSLAQALASPRSAPTVLPKDSPQQQLHGTPPRGSPPSTKQELTATNSGPRPSKLRYDSHDAEGSNTPPRISDLQEEMARGRSQSSAPPSNHASPPTSLPSSSSSPTKKPPAHLAPSSSSSSSSSLNVNAEQVKNVLSVCKESATAVIHCVNQVKVKISNLLWVC